MKVSYEVYRDNLLLMIAYYKNLDCASPYIKDSKATSTYKDRMDLLNELAAIIIHVDKYDDEDTLKFELLHGGVNDIFKHLKSAWLDTEYNRVHYNLQAFASASYEQELDLNKNSYPLPLNYFVEVNDNKYIFTFIVDEVENCLRQCSDLIVLSDKKNTYRLNNESSSTISLSEIYNNIFTNQVNYNELYRSLSKLLIIEKSTDPESLQTLKHKIRNILFPEVEQYKGSKVIADIMKNRQNHKFPKGPVPS